MRKQSLLIVAVLIYGNLSVLAKEATNAASVKTAKQYTTSETGNLRFVGNMCQSVQAGGRLSLLQSLSSVEVALEDTAK